MRDEIHLMLLIHDKYDQERSKRNWRDRENAATGGNMRVSGGGVTAPGPHTGQWSPVELVPTLVSGPRRGWHYRHHKQLRGCNYMQAGCDGVIQV